jgi:radical SAM superfamily enzyme YgiQ (UPF0313 family)
LNRVKKLRPDIVAFSVISDNYKWTLETAKQIKDDTKAKIIFGGVHPTSVPEYVLKDGIADYLIIGEGEQAFVDLVSALEKGNSPEKIANICGYKPGGYYLNPVRPPIQDLDSLPFPDKDLFFNECRMIVSDSYTIMGSRGCNNSCSYCWNSLINNIYPGGIYFRRRSPENVIKELKWARERYAIKKVTFYDEVFTSDKEWFRKFLGLYSDELGLPFFCCVHPRDIDEESVKLLSDSGCAALNIGIQTASEEIRRRILNRSGPNSQIINALRLLRDTKIFVYSNIILGLPEGGEEEAVRTLKFCSINKSDLPSIYWLRYYPGTRIINIAKDNNVLTDEAIEKINASKEYSPYAISGNTYTRDISRLGNLILLSGIIPSKTIDFIIDHKLYRYMISRNLLFPVIVFMGWIKRLISGKRYPLHYLNLSGYLRFYWFYILKKINYALEI